MAGSKHKAKGDTYERDLARFFNERIPPCYLMSECRRAALSGGGHSDGGFDLMGPRLRLARFDTSTETFGPYTAFEYELGVEAKRTERLNIRDALQQAHLARHKMERAGVDVSKIVPVVITRRNREPIEHSIVALRLEDFLTLMCGGPTNG